MFIRDVPRAVKFYHEGLGLTVTKYSPNFAEFDLGSNTRLLVQQAVNESVVSTGYSPMLNFDVADLNTTITSLISHGAVMDGPIQYPEMGKVAAVRSPDGHMIGLFEPAEENIPHSEENTGKSTNAPDVV